MPYSVIRGEAFTLKATVLNYLPKCIRVSVQLNASPAFLASQNEKREESYCICGNEWQILSWTVTPETLGNVNSSVSAEIMPSLELCRNEVVDVSEIERKDTLIKTLLVDIRIFSFILTLAKLITMCLEDVLFGMNLPAIR
ncbi:pregnancy zone protein-like [Lemur catta]|uniref:pregnancy zone protein-like n=1 Tax=Lemur catta TaxID=9447 RepID=UPI001E2669A6|nr:pregnancy zone protein-like [Lemur catta]